jgi:uncharacterized damage-inducible protein DinB
MAARRPLNLERELIEAFEHSGRVTEYLVGVLPKRLWQQPSPTGHGRTVAAIIVHIHGLRRTFARMGGIAVGEPLNRTTVTPAAAKRALKAINAAVVRTLRDSLAGGAARVPGMPRRTVAMMAYLQDHDAHHRGQIMLRARELGHQFTGDDVMRVWGWKKLP